MASKRNRLLVIPLLISAVLIWLLWPHTSAKAGWFDDNWFYRTAITIGNTGSADANKKVKFDIDTATLISAGKMQSDCGDSRFTDINGKPLKYYIDTVGGACNGASTDYYVLVPVINSGNTTLYHYYGNTSAPNGTGSSLFSEATFAPTSGPNTASEEKSLGPAASWSFNEGTGTTTNDATVNNNDGTISNAVWKRESDCISGKCLYFDGTGDYTQVSDSGSLDIADTITISAWVKPNLINSTRQDIITKASAFEFRIHTDDTFRVKFFNLTDDFLTGTMPTLIAGDWVYLAATYDGTNISAYVNGELVLQDDSSGTITTNSNNLTIGAESASATTPFKGFIDEARIYPYARSTAQIKADYAARGSINGAGTQIGAGDPGSGEKLSQGLVGYWKLDENTGTSASDFSGNNYNTSTFTGSSAPSWTAGKFGTALQFDGTNDYTSVADTSSLEFSANDNFSVSFWVKDGGANVNNNSIVEKWAGSGGYPYSFRINPSYSIGFRRYDGTNTSLANGTKAINDGSWHLVTGTKNGSTINLYIDGVMTATSSDTTTGTTTNSSGLYFGARGSGSYYQGTLDDIRIYNRTLDPSEISALYNWAPGPIGYWKMDENTGTSSTADNSGNDNSMTINNMAESNWVTGKFGSALKFDGNKWGNLTNSSYDNLASFTWESWIYHTESGVTDTVLAKGSAKKDFNINNSNQLSMTITTDSVSAVSTSTDTLSANTWYHVAATYNDNDGIRKIKLYINGKQVNYGTQTAATGTVSSDSGATLWFATDQSGSQEYTGYLDDVKIYNYVRTSAQIIEDMNGGHPIGGSPIGSQVGYWKFNEGRSTTAFDQSDNQNHLTLSTAVSSWTNNGKFEKAWIGGGTNYAYRTDDSDFDFSSTDDFTITLWASVTCSANQQFLLVKGSEAGYNLSVYPIDGSNDGKIFFNIVDDLSGSDNILSTTSFCDSGWRHIAARKTGTNSIDIFINGKRENSDFSLAATSTLANTESLIIGDFDGVDNNDELQNGSIDEIKIYRAALTDEEIKIDFNRGQSTVFGSLSTSSDGNTPSDSASRSYCVPGDTSTCNPPIAEWQFDEKNGTIGYDNSGNNLTQTLTNGPSWKNGKYGTGINFDGTDDYTTGTALNFGSNRSISMWAYINDTSTTQMLFTNGHSTTDRTDIGIDNGSIRGRFYDGTTTYPASGTITGSGWYHITFTFDSTTPKLYINGNLQTGTANKTSNYANTLELGRRNDGSEYFRGILDNVKAFNYIRTSAQIAWDYNLGQPMAYYRFDECQGTTAFDSAPNYNESLTGNNGTITIGVSGSNTSAGTCAGDTTEAWKNGANGKINSSISLDGTNDYVTIPAVFDPSSTDFTVALWIYPQSINAQTGFDRVIINQQDGTGTGRSWLYIDNSTGEIRTFVGGSGKLSGYLLSTNVWTHVAMVHNNSANTITWFVNGVQITTNTSVNATSATGNLILGSRKNLDGGFFHGKMDSLKIFRHTMTPAQIKTLYNDGSAAQFAPITGSP